MTDEDLTSLGYRRHSFPFATILFMGDTKFKFFAQKSNIIDLILLINIGQHAAKKNTGQDRANSNSTILFINLSPLD
jgi:hypothetical protein